MSWPTSPRDRGFERLGTFDNDGDGPYVDKDKQSAAVAKAAPAPDAAAGSGDAKQKKHYLKFLSRSKRRVVEPSSKSKAASKENANKSTKKKAALASAENKSNSAANADTTAVSTGSSVNEAKERGKAAGTGTATSTRDDAEAEITPREDIDVSVDGREEARDGPPDAPHQQNSIEGRDAAPEGSGEALQKPYIVRRKVQQPLPLRVPDKDPSGELMIDPSAPPPAWCANFTAVDDPTYYEDPQTMTTASSASATSNCSPSVYATAAPSLKPEVSPSPEIASESFTDTYADLMTSASEDAMARPSSPLGLRRTMSEECFSSLSKRELASPAKSAKKARARPSPEMGMRPPRRATSTASGGISTLRSGSPRPEDMLRRSTSTANTFNTSPAPRRSRSPIPNRSSSPAPNRSRFSPKPPRPHVHPVLGSLIGDSKKGAVSESQKSIKQFNQHLSAEPSENESKGSFPNSFNRFAPVLPSLDKEEEMEAKVEESATSIPVKESPFSVLDRAVITIQSAIRGHLARQEALIKMGSIIMIQSVIRRHIAVVEGFSRRGGIVSIQAWYRGELVRNELEYLRWCAMEIQSLWRQHVARREYESTKAKLIVAQSAWRGHIAKKNYRTRREQIIKIQTLARQRAAEKNLETSRNAAASIQASVRGAACRKEYKKAVSSAILIQSVVRGSASRTDYIATIQAVVRLQSIARQKVAQNQFDISRSAASTIQASFRGAMCRREFKKTISSLILIQSFARTAFARAQYVATIEAAVRLQAFARKVEGEKRYQSVLSGVIKLQSAARRVNAQRRYLATRQVAVATQTFARRTKARRDFLLAIKAVVLLQSTARMSSEQKKYVARRKEEARVAAAVVVQSTWRRYHHEMAYVDAIIAATIIQAYTRRYMSQREYQKHLQIYREEQAREQQRAAEQEALRKSALAVQRRKLEQERLEVERLRREERERIEEQERLRQEECKRIEQQRQKELAPLEAERRIREEEKEEEELQADILAEFDVKETQKIVKKRNETEHSAVQAPKVPMSPPKRSVAAAGASPSIKDRIRMFNGGASGAGTASPSPAPFGRSPCNKPVFRAASPVVVSKKSSMVNEVTNKPTTPKSPLLNQTNNFESGTNVRQSRFKPTNNPSSPVPARSFARLQPKAASPIHKPEVPRSPAGPSTKERDAVGTKQISPLPSPRKSSVVPSAPSSAEDSTTGLKSVSPRNAEPKVSGGGTFDFQQLKSRFDAGNKPTVTESTSGNDSAQTSSNHQSPKFKQTIKTKILAWDAPQGPTMNKVSPRVDERVKMEESVAPKYGQSEPKNKLTVDSRPANDNDGWEDFGRTATFASTFGSFGSTSWKKPQPKSRNDTGSCPDDVLNSFKQIQASAAKPSPQVTRRETNNSSERPSNVLKLRPSQRDTPTLDHNTTSQLSSPSSKPRAVSRTRGIGYQGDNSLRRERRMARC